MIVCKNRTGNICLVIRSRLDKTDAIFTEHGHRRIRTLRTSDFNKQYTPVENSTPAKLARIWLASTIKLTDKVKKELKMAENCETQEVLTAAEQTKIDTKAEKEAIKAAKAEEKAAAKALKDAEKAEAKAAKELAKAEKAAAGGAPRAAKGEGKYAYVHPLSTFSALESTRKVATSRRTTVHDTLAELGEATAADVAKVLELDVKAVLGDLRCLVADGKAVVTAVPEVEEQKAA